MDKPANQMTDLLEELETIASYYGNDFEGNETKEHRIITQAIGELRATREMLEAATSVSLFNRTPKLPFADRYILIPAIRDDENELRPATQNFAELLAMADDSGVGCVLSEHVPLTNVEGEEVIYTLPKFTTPPRGENNFVKVEEKC